MSKIYLGISLVIIFNIPAFPQVDLRGMYIDNFNQIVGNTVKEDSLLHYAQDSAYNYLALYSLHQLNLNNASTANTLAAFIYKAKVQYGITYIGAVCESYSSFATKITPYNLSRTNDNERFNVFNMEFEFWVNSSVQPGGYYCTSYLQQANCSCDTSGAFRYYLSQMHQIDSLAQTQNVISETYLGWFNEGQAQQILPDVDRILLHAYTTGSSSLFNYTRTRLQYLASSGTMVNVAPIFSAEPSFMGPWLVNHTQFEPYDTFMNDYNNDNSSWKQYIHLLGYQWFDWGYMPKQTSGTSGIFPAPYSKKDNFENPDAFKTYPNPSGDNLILEFNSDLPGLAEFRITDLTGRLAYSDQQLINTGANKIKFSLSGIESGQYILTFQNKTSVFSKKVFVSH